MCWTAWMMQLWTQTPKISIYYEEKRHKITVQFGNSQKQGDQQNSWLTGDAEMTKVLPNCGQAVRNFHATFRAFNLLTWSTTYKTDTYMYNFSHTILSNKK